VLNPSQMLRTEIGYKFSEYNIENQSLYRLSVNDVISFKLSTNDGEKLIDPLQNRSLGLSGYSSGSYVVEYDGTIKLPLFGRVKVAGLTLRECEELLEKMYSSYFNKPFVEVKVSNSRVIVFNGGSGGEAQVVPLDEPNMTLFEALAKAGGITNGKSHKIKLIRGDMKSPQVYNIDLSTLKNAQRGNVILQNNDIIYVEPVFAVPQQIVSVLMPYMSLVTTLLTIIILFK